MRSRLTAALAAAFRRTATILVPLAFACSTESLGPGQSIESVFVAPTTATVSVGASLSLSAEVRDGNGTMIPVQRVSWASEDPAIAEVNASGVVTGRKVGSVLIAASSWGKDAFARVTVNPTPVVAIRLTSTHRAMFVGEVVQLGADPLDSDGNVLANRPITWSTSDPAIATVTDNGQVTALAVGGAIITASAEGRSAVASITVSTVPVGTIVITPDANDLVVGQTAQLAVLVRDGAGNLLVGRAVSWGSSSPQVATVTSEGLVTAVSQGNATISASSEGKTATATINVTPRPASAVILSPGQVSIFPGQSMQLNALVTDDRGQLLPGRPVSYSSDKPQFATVSSTGVVTGVATGAATITATSEGASGTASVTVMPEPVALVQVSPSTPSVTVGQAVQLTAVPLSSGNKVLTGRTITWTSGAPGVASVSSLGTVTGVAPGTAVIVASVDGTQGSAVVTVRPVPVASVTVTPPTAGAAIGQTITLTATLRDVNGNLLAGRIIAWTSSDNAIATVSGTGVVTGVAVGSATITATSEGQTGSSSISIAAVAVASVNVSPPSANVNVGQTAQLAATALDAGGKVLTGRIVNWSSGTPGVATVSTSGLVTGVSAGSATITATIDGVPGTALVTVIQVPVASVSVAPSTATTSIGQTVTLTATMRDASNNILAGRVVTWTTSAAGTATVSTNGVVTGVSAGTATITATSEGQSGSATITVNGPPVATTLTVSPSTTNVIINTTATLAATVRDQFGNVMSGLPITWSSSNAAVASVSTAGVVSGVALGSATITASSGTLNGTASVTVVPVPVDRIVVTPADITVNPGQSVQYVATLYDANNNVLTGRTVTWTSSRPTRVSINSSTGLAFAIRDVGSVTITASSGGKTGTATIHVN